MVLSLVECCRAQRECLAWAGSREDCAEPERLSPSESTVDDRGFRGRVSEEGLEMRKASSDGQRGRRGMKKKTDGEKRGEVVAVGFGMLSQVVHVTAAPRRMAWQAPVRLLLVASIFRRPRKLLQIPT